MEANDIEKIFREKLGNLEEIPKEEIWEKVAFSMPDYSSSSQLSFFENISQTIVKTGKLIVQTKGLIITIGTSVTLIGTIFVYNSINKNKPAEFDSKNNSIIINHVNTEENGLISEKQKHQEYNKTTAPSKEALVNTLEKSKLVKAQTKPMEESNPSEIKNDISISTTSTDTTIVTKQENLVKSEKAIEKVESFYEKKARLLKDSTRSVFKPE